MEIDAALSQKQRDALPSSDFAVPGKRALPMHDEKHARLAWDMVDRTEGLSDAERKTARSRIKRRAKELGIDTADWKAAAETDSTMLFSTDFQAMSLAVPETPDHPNKMPFSGILTRIDEPSDKPPEGSGGRRVVVTRAAAEKALSTLLGMAVDFRPDLAGHDVQQKVGVITAATIDGNAIRIEGFFYAADFPQEVGRIRATKADMGFSYEATRVTVADWDADPLVVTDCVFTGAAVLRKDKAAYTTTSLTAHSEEIEMTADELKKLLGEAVAPIAAQVTDLSATVTKIQGEMKAGFECAALVEPHAKALYSAADTMEKAGVGVHPTRGHAVAVRKVADDMMASAHTGSMPAIYRDHAWPFDASAAPLRSASLGDDPALKTLEAQIAKLATDNAAAIASVKAEAEAATKAALDAKDAEIADLKTKVTDLAAKATDNSGAPDRKTLSPAITALLARGGLVEPAAGEKMSIAVVDAALAKMDLPAVKRMEFKRELERNSLI